MKSSIEKQLCVGCLMQSGSFAQDAYNLATGDAKVEQAKKDILTTLVKAIIKNPKAFILAIKASGITIADNASNETIVKAISANQNNAALGRAVGKILSPSNAIGDGDGDGDGGGGGGFWSGLVGAIGGLANAGASVYSTYGAMEINKSQSQLAANQNATQQQMLALLAQQQNKPKEGLSTGAWIGIAAGGALLLTTVIVLIVKK